MNTTIPKIETVIDFSLADTKNAIEGIKKVVKPQDGNGFYHKSTNEIFGLYEFNILNTDSISGLVSGTLSVSISTNTATTTNITVSAIANTQGVMDNSRVMDVQHHFLKLLSSKLSGEDGKEVTQQRLNSQPDPAIPILIFVVIIIIFIILYVTN